MYKEPGLEPEMPRVEGGLCGGLCLCGDSVSGAAEVQVWLAPGAKETASALR